jgi:hypothetical protein
MKNKEKNQPAPFTLIRSDGTAKPRAPLSQSVMDSAAWRAASFVEGVIDAEVKITASSLTHAARTLMNHVGAIRDRARTARILAVADVFVRCAEDITALGIGEH